MTLNDLNKEVAALGFESTVELDEAFLYCANRALLTVFTERPLKKTVRLPVIKAPCLSYTECIVHHSGDVITLPLSCTCASFRVSGKGSFTLVGGYERRTEFDTPDSLFRIFCEDFNEIRFEGAYYFTVHSLALYGERFGEGEDTIPEY
ncbi:MAG: hypothetical protein IIX96_00220, partial [Clostridia bacterium]|nr:hypothetical protein [Clostridia bacterium]